MNTLNNRRLEAKRFFEQKQYTEAGKLYEEEWEQRGDSYSGSRYIHCLRKTNRLDDALTIARQVREKCPGDIYVIRELVWTLYEGEFKPAKESGDLNGVMRVGHEVLGLTDELLPRKLIVFGVIDVAKEKMKWAIINQWCDFIPVEMLDDAQRQIDGRQVISEREQWYFAKVKSLVNLEHWEEARARVLEALQISPRNRDFRRWGAQALAGIGDLDTAIAELRMLVEERNPSWYALRDLAQVLYQKGILDEAYSVACQAALAHGEDKAKIHLFSLIAQVALDQGQLEVAWLHITYTRLVMIGEGWRIPGEISNLEKQISEAASQIALVLPEEGDPRQLRSSCKRHWQQSIASVSLATDPKSDETASPVKVGKVKNYNVDRGFGFIRPDDGGRDLFFHITNYRGDTPVPGLVVEYQVIEGKKGLEAVAVRAHTNR